MGQIYSLKYLSWYQTEFIFILKQLLATMRRPLGQRAQDIGVWAGILRAITMLSVLTNVSFNWWYYTS